MDKTTHEIRIANWRPIIEQCQARPEGQSAKQWLADNGISEKTYYYWQRKVRQETNISRLGNGAYNPSIQLLEKIALAVGKELVVEFV